MTRPTCVFLVMILGGERALGVVASVIGTWFDIGECIGFVGGKGDYKEKFDIKDLFDVTLCGHNRQTLRSGRMFCKLPILFE
jgi:hypothetical protein